MGQEMGMFSFLRHTFFGLGCEVQPNQLVGQEPSYTGRQNKRMCREELTLPKRGMAFALGSWEVISKSLECPAQ